ncbi:unnamed protein product [Coccothraustes coccothraustes]
MLPAQPQSPAPGWERGSGQDTEHPEHSPGSRACSAPDSAVTKQRELSLSCRHQARQSLPWLQIPLALFP